jgi:23S rRNA (adenine2503-C2)-methyltransferase
MLPEYFSRMYHKMYFQIHMINVLQYNPTSNSKIRAPQKQEMVAFKHQLEQTGLEVTMRVSHGREIKAACGQLANTYNKAKKQQK